ncbi:hypothetical protein [Streptomyces fractus]|uniref:hypothetical protein n=1 Tax=Streptomyces fractus TaxID=641806 RepID=UPI003CE918F3
MASQAIVIAPSQYADGSGLQRHASIAASGDLYERVLKQDPLWGPENLTVLDRAQLGSVPKVMAALQEKARLVGASDTLLVVYVGHGAAWEDVPGAQVHFAVESSRKNEPWTWLNSWYLYRAIRTSNASLKVLIADCCFSNKLPGLGGDTPPQGLRTDGLPGVLGHPDGGTCVLSALEGDRNLADPKGCPHLPDEFSQCTAFSGHLLHQLDNGTKGYDSDWTLSFLREAVWRDMADCDAHSGQVPEMTLKGRGDSILFTNQVAPGSRTQIQEPQNIDEWTKVLKLNFEHYTSQLQQKPLIAGEIVAELRRPQLQQDDQSQYLAERIDTWACTAYSDPEEFYQYWTTVERKLQPVPEGA